MPNINIVKYLPKSESYNFRYVCDRYDLDVSKFNKNWSIEFDFPKEWSIGLIVGNSGSGKSLISKEIFKKVYLGQIIQETQIPLIETFSDIPIDKIISALSSVGMGSVPEWLTPYSCLSTGQKMRADLAYCLLSDEEIIAYDEFTSVVDRQVAKIVSHSIAKAFRKKNKKFVAITCHHDVEEWLEPDWVLDMDVQEYRTSQKKNPQFPFQYTPVKDPLGNFSKIITI